MENQTTEPQVQSDTQTESDQSQPVAPVKVEEQQTENKVDFKSLIPDEYKEDKALANFQNMDQFVKSYLHANKMTGLDKIPVPNKTIQLTIVKKIDNALKQKQQKEHEAQRKLESIDSYLLKELGVALPKDGDESLADRVFFRKFSEVSGERIDGNAHHSKRTKTISSVKLSKYPIKSLKTLSSFSKEITLTNSKKLPYIGLENIESNTGVYQASTEKESFSSAVKFKKGQILFPKLRPYLNKVYFAEFNGLCSTEFHILDSDKVNNQYLGIFLRSIIIVNQTKYLMSGNTLPRLQTDDIKNLLIVVPPSEIQNKIVEYITTLRDEAKVLKKEAIEIYNNAKEEVEKMILGEK